MKKIFSSLGFITIICMSFLISKQTTTVVKDIDGLLTELKEQSKKYEQQPIDAKINQNTIIPGLNGKKINIEKTYKEIKKIGIINEKYFIYDQIKPAITIKKEHNKYIVSGNPEKNMISIIILVQENDDITKILKILENNQVKANFFIDEKWILNNKKIIQSMIDKEYTISTINTNEYQNEEYIWLDNILKNKTNQKSKYCYTEKENDKTLETCAKQKKYTIKPNIQTDKKPLAEIKKEITSGSIISLKINEETNKQLPLIINYIKTKGYTIETLTNHLSEVNEN